MTYIDIIDNFTISTKSNFPSNECNIIDRHELGVLNGENWYLCLCVDMKFDDEIMIRKLKPYTWTGSVDDSDTFNVYYGWVDIYGNPYENIENSINTHMWYPTVIAFSIFEDDDCLLKYIDYLRNGVSDAN
jgi:hypothetical protein